MKFCQYFCFFQLITGAFCVISSNLSLMGNTEVYSKCSYQVEGASRSILMTQVFFQRPFSSKVS
jgi:hypothetical protein